MFHERLAALRDKKGLSQKEIATRLGMARTTYSGYENGSREPDLKTLNKIAEFYEVNVDWLVTGTKTAMNEEDKKLLKNFNKLNDKDQEYILELMERLRKE